MLSGNQVKTAGKVLREVHDHQPDELRRALETLETWRGVHAYPLNTAQIVLRARIATATGEKPEVAQRLKELASIVAKLRRGAPRMQLTTMQDIAGCRGVVGSLDAVYKVVDTYRRSASRKSTVVDIDDYIASPAESGYRGVHVIAKTYDRPNDTMRFVEIQLRTRVQHDWAVGVEDLGKRYGYAFKQSEGPAEVLDYLRVASQVFEAEEVNGSVRPSMIDALNRARDAAREALERK
ncbi:MAG: RelA/SpoT domain-containing protein [Nitriliruptoraceae bacterium]